MTQLLLQASRITKRFGGVAALSDVDFSIHAGEVHAICGENGAGKSTLIRVLSGFYPWHSVEGQLLWQGQPLQLDGVRSGEAIGIAVVHQEFSLIREMTIAENLFMGHLPQKGLSWDWAATIVAARKMLQRFDLDLDPEMIVEKCSIPVQQLVEIAKALARSPKLLILDEPTAALGPAETNILLRTIDVLRKEGVACVYISHKLNEVISIADCVTVLRDGRSIATYPRANCSTSRIIRDMVGRQIEDIYPVKNKSHPNVAELARVPEPAGNSGVREGNSGTSRDVLLKLDCLSARSANSRAVQLRDISCEIRSGEIVGIGGLMGAGRSELLMHLYGLWGTRIGGEVLVAGDSYTSPSPRRSLERGMMMVTEDRKRLGLIPGHSTHYNVSLSSLHSVATAGWIRQAQEHRRNAAMLVRTQFRALSDQTLVERLSGGNQQKVVFARGLLCDPRILLLDEPTRGVDVGARCELYRRIQQSADQGKAIVWVSSDLSELIGMCDRIMIMHQGRIGDCFQREDGFDADALMASALGSAGRLVRGSLREPT